MNNYLGSVASTGKQLAAYVDSFRDDPEPVVLVFFGDHKPTLGAGNSFYEELGVNVQEGTAEGFYNLYTTPYLIWTNDAAKAVLGRSDPRHRRWYRTWRNPSSCPRRPGTGWTG